MPIALLQYDPGRVQEEVVKDLAEHLPRIVANYLSVPGTNCQLTPADVNVWVNPVGLLDVNKKDLVIVVWAGLHAEREKNLDERRRDIAMAIRLRCMFAVKRTGFVWILLQPDSFEEWW